MLRKKEVFKVANKSRADYFKERRKKSNSKVFYVEVNKEQLEKLEQKLLQKNKTKKEWLIEKIEQEIK